MQRNYIDQVFLDSYPESYLGLMHLLLGSILTSTVSAVSNNLTVNAQINQKS